MRVWFTEGRLYVARDQVGKFGAVRPEHAIMRDGEIVWETHKEGAVIEPLFRDVEVRWPLSTT